MKRDKVRRIALAAALASTMFISGTPEFSYAQTVTDVIATLSSQVRVSDFAASRATIRELQQVGIGAINVGTETITLEDLLAMIDAAEEGRLDPVALAAYLEALAASAGLALFVPAQVPTLNAPDLIGTFPAGSSG